MLKVQDRTTRMQKLIDEKRANFFFRVLVLVFLLAAFVALYINHLPGWDESVYIGMGKYIFSSGKAGGWEMMRPVALPFLLGLLWKTGLSMVYSTKLLAVAFSALNIFLVFAIGKRLFGPLAGLAASFFLAITPVFFFRSTYGLTGIPSAAFALLALYLLVKEYSFFWVGVCAALAFLFRFPQGLFFAAVMLAIFLASLKRPKTLLKNSLLCSAGFLAALIPFLIFNYSMYGADVGFLVAILRPVIIASSQQLNPFFQHSLSYYPMELFRTNPFLVFSVAGVAYFFIKKDYKMPKVLIMACFAIFLLYFSLVLNKQLRFAFTFLPYMALLAGFGFSWIMRCRRLRLAVLALSFAVGMPAACYHIAALGTFGQQDYSILEVYSYFNDHPVEGAVLTTIPYPMVYSDIRFKPYYYAPDEPFSELKEDVSAVMLVPSIFLCTEDDIDCQNKRGAFFNGARGGTLAFSRKHYGNSFEVYLIS